MTVLLLCLAQFVDVLGVTVVVTALPSMLADLHAPASAAALVVTSYAMLFGGLLMLGARLGDRFGHRRVLLCGLALFAGGSLLAATATSVVTLAVARGTQGAAAAVSVPAALRLLSAVASDENDRRRALAAWSATGAAAGASGFLLGGLVTQVAGWRAVFWLNVPLALLIGAGLRALLPADRGEPRHRLDIAGAVLLTAAVMAAVAGGSLAERPERLVAGLLLIVVAVLLGAAFVWTERRVAGPLVPVAAVRHPRLRTGAAGSFLNTATTSSAVALATLELQNSFGASPAQAGLLFLPFSLCVIAGSTAAAPLLRRRPPRAAIGLGLGLIAAGDATLLALHVGIWAVPVGVAVAGLGIGLSSVAATTIGTDVPADLAGTAAGVLNTAAQLGTALGIAAIFVVAQTTSGTGWAISGAYLGWCCAAAGAAAGAVALARRSHDRPTGAPAEERRDARGVGATPA